MSDKNNNKTTHNIRKKEGYLPNPELVEEVIRCQDDGKVSVELATMFRLLAERTSTHRFFVRYPFREDLVSEGTLICIEKFDKFDRNRLPEGQDIPNAHAYFTSIIFNKFRAFLSAEYKQKNIKDEMRLANEMDPSFGYDDDFEKKREQYEEEDYE